ncbi:M23 family metallopeptidase [Candidatus Micrarchaeota archaeon]|nr:M23 family metallopeptidase [Candidatus Micrarchaeota archaeon]
MAGKKDSEKSGFGRRVYSVQSEGVIPIPSSAEFEAIMRGIPPGVGEYDSPRRGGKSKHCGVDIYSDKGASARAVVAGEGVVLFAGRMDSTAGNVVRVLGRDDRGDVVVTSYHHCERVLVKAGDVVQG